MSQYSALEQASVNFINPKYIDSLGKHEIHPDFARSSKDSNNSIKDLRINKELNIREFKDFDIDFDRNDGNNESATIISIKDKTHYISDGRPQSLKRNKSNNIMKDLLLKTVGLNILLCFIAKII